MSFLDPSRLWLLLLPAAGGVGLVWASHRRRRYTLRFSDLSLVDEVAPHRPGWRRVVPPAAFLLGLVAVVVALARPVMAVRVPLEAATVILAVDVSLSMEADDVPPSRIDAAKEAAGRFLDLAPAGLRVGVVSFSGVAAPVLPPTADREAARQVVASLTLGEGTAIGEAIFVALDLIAAERARLGDDTPAAIVVLSDGETTMGRSELDAAADAAAAGIPVSTIAFGTDRGSIVFEGETVPVPVNDASLRAVAERTGGQAFDAATAEELEAILDEVGSRLAYTTERREVSGWFLGGALGLLVVAGAASVVWFGRLP